MDDILIITQAFNTAPALFTRSVESVLNQTHKNFKYVLIDNASTNEVMRLSQEYAAADPRVELVRLIENRSDISNHYAVARNDCAYTTYLDSDDWLHPDYLAELYGFAAANDLDVVCTGSNLYGEGAGVVSKFSVETPRIFAREEFAEGFPEYYRYFKPLWGKLIRSQFINFEPKAHIYQSLLYGGDTLFALGFLTGAQRMGIHNSALHNYYMGAAGISRSYPRGRFGEVSALCEGLDIFVAGFGEVSPQNRKYLDYVYCDNLVFTSELIEASDLPAEDRVAEYAGACALPRSVAMFAQSPESFNINGLENPFLRHVLTAGALLAPGQAGLLQGALAPLFPNTARYVTPSAAAALLADRMLFRLFLGGDGLEFMPAVLCALGANGGEGCKPLSVLHPGAARLGADEVWFTDTEDARVVLSAENIAAAFAHMGALLRGNRLDITSPVFLNVYMNFAAALGKSGALSAARMRRSAARAWHGAGTALIEAARKRGLKEKAYRLAAKLGEKGLLIDTDSRLGVKLKALLKKL